MACFYCCQTHPESGIWVYGPKLDHRPEDLLGMNLRTCCLGCSLFGGAVWLIWAALIRPDPFQPAWAVTLLLLAPLVLVPLGLRLVLPERQPQALRLAVYLQLPAALLLLASFSMP